MGKSMPILAIVLGAENGPELESGDNAQWPLENLEHSSVMVEPFWPILQTYFKHFSSQVGAEFSPNSISPKTKKKKYA